MSSSIRPMGRFLRPRRLEDVTALYREDRLRRRLLRRPQAKSSDDQNRSVVARLGDFLFGEVVLGAGVRDLCRLA